MRGAESRTHVQTGQRQTSPSIQMAAKKKQRAGDWKDETARLTAARRELAGDVARLNAILADDPDTSAARDLRERAEAAAKAMGKLGADAAELLCWAAGNGRVDLVKALLKRGADPGRACPLHIPGHFPDDDEREPTEADWFAEEYEPTHIDLRPLGAAVHGGHADVARLLIDAGADVNADAGGGPPIFHAVRRGHAKVVELLIERGADLSVRDASGDTLLYEVAGSTHADVADILLRAGADPNERNGDGLPPLVAAAIRGDVRIVRALLAAGAEVNPPKAARGGRSKGARRKLAGDEDNWSPPLVYAADIGHLEVVRTLLDAGADVTAKDGYGQTAYEAARRQNRREIAMLLKDAGAAAKPSKARPVDLLMAAEIGDVAAVREAIARGMRVDMRSGIHDEAGLGSQLKGVKPKDRLKAVMGAFTSMDAGMRMFSAMMKDAEEERQGAAWHHGMSPLHIASKHGHAEVVRVLLEADATRDLRSSEPEHSGWTALHYAAAGNHVKVMRLLIDAGADVANEAEDILGDATGTPLHVAAAHGQAEAVRLLLERGGKHASTAGGDVPLARAAAGGHHDVIRLLLDAGAKPDGRAGKNGRTALHAAAGAGRVETVKLLLDAGVDPNVAGDEGTPLNAAANGDIARRSGDKQRMLAVMKVLIDAGADVNRAGTDGETPLFNAVRTPPAVELLLARGANPKRLARDGCNALHRAVAHNKLESVKMLLAAGVDPNVIGREERYTCLDAAVVRGHTQCRALLEAAGAKRAKQLRKAGPTKAKTKTKTKAKATRKR